jgi:hypothetical protein
MHLLQKEARKDDPDPKALSCYGLYLPELSRSWLRFVDGRPVSAITTQFLSWSCQRLEALWAREGSASCLWDMSGTMPPGTRASSSRNGSPLTTAESKTVATECA